VYPSFHRLPFLWVLGINIQGSQSRVQGIAQRLAEKAEGKDSQANGDRFATPPRLSSQRLQPTSKEQLTPSPRLT